MNVLLKLWFNLNIQKDVRKMQKKLNFYLLVNEQDK